MSLPTKHFNEKPPQYGKKKIGFSRPPSISFFRVLKISLFVFFEFFRGLLFLRRYELSASFFGSARESLDNRYYEEAEKLAAMLAKKGFSIITGGAGGIMRAANRGAYLVQGDSAGVNILLPEEQEVNKFVNRSITFDHFFIRKTILSCASEVYIFFPGGFGTLDELFELLTLIQTKQAEIVPIILMGKEYWDPIYAILEEEFAKKHKTISPRDLSLVTIFDKAEEAERHIDRLGVMDTRLCKYTL